MKGIYCSVEEAIDVIRAGQILVVVDDENRENEGDFLMAAEHITPQKVNFMMTYGRGLICTPISETIAVELGLDPMVLQNEDPHGTAFTVSIDGVGTGTGISASSRAKTISMLADGISSGQDFQRPGHIFPLIAKSGGVLERPGHTEATLDLMQLAGLREAGVICEIIKEDGEMARMPDLEVLAAEHKLKILTIEALAEYQKTRQCAEQPLVTTVLPTEFGDFDLYAFSNKNSKEPHLALVMGDVSEGAPLIRMHSECMTGDVFGSRRCDCGQQLEDSMRAIAKEKKGVILYLRQEGRGIGLVNKLKAYALQDSGMDTVQANLELGREEDERDYNQALAMLETLGVQTGRLMTNNPLKLSAFDKSALNVTRCDSLKPVYHTENEKYLNTKVEKMGHLYEQLNCKCGA